MKKIKNIMIGITYISVVVGALAAELDYKIFSWSMAWIFFIQLIIISILSYKLEK